MSGMKEIHSRILHDNFSVLTCETHLRSLVPKLISGEVFTQSMVDRILHSHTDERIVLINLYLEVPKRGPSAFNKLITALSESGHNHLANLLQNQERIYMEALHRGVFHGAIPNGSNRPHGREVMQYGSAESNLQFQSRDSPDSMPHNVNFPTHSHHGTMPLPGSLDIGTLRSLRRVGPDDFVDASGPKFRLPIVVTRAKKHEVQVNHISKKPQIYHMTSRPRGYALIINNIEFHDEARRNGAQNDDVDLEEVLKQLYFTVESHRNLTADQMERKVFEFSKKTFTGADCIIVALMSHGHAGQYGDEDTEVKGIDSAGVNIRKILEYFSNAECPQLIGKPKVFLCQSCRGDLDDEGVNIDAHDVLESNSRTFQRTEIDGRARVKKKVVRKMSDMFVAFPVLPGYTANRDFYDGAWFIQSVVKTFANHACNVHLDDMFKIVDAELTKWRNLGPDDDSANLQTVTTKTYGWNKQLFFNPGLSYVDGQLVAEEDELNGVDVVDTPSECQSHMNTSDLVKLTTEEDDSLGGCLCLPCHPS